MGRRRGSGVDEGPVRPVLRLKTLRGRVDYTCTAARGGVRSTLPPLPRLSLGGGSVPAWISVELLWGRKKPRRKCKKRKPGFTSSDSTEPRVQPSSPRDPGFTQVPRETPGSRKFPARPRVHRLETPASGARGRRRSHRGRGRAGRRGASRSTFRRTPRTASEASWLEGAGGGAASGDAVSGGAAAPPRAALGNGGGGAGTVRKHCLVPGAPWQMLQEREPRPTMHAAWQKNAHVQPILTRCSE